MINWLLSKVGILLFALVVFVSLVSFGLMVRGFSTLDSNYREAFTLARAIDSICSTPFNAETTVVLRSVKQISAGPTTSTGFFVSVQRSRRAVHCPVLPGSFSASRVVIKKTNGLVMLS